MTLLTAGINAPARARRLSFRTALNGVLVVAALLLATLSVPVVTGMLMDRLQTIPPIAPADLVAAAGDRAHCAIVILSAGRRHEAPEFGGETVDAVSLERLRYGALVARQTGLPVLVSGGLASPDEAALARLMAEELKQDYGIDARWLEDRSANTMENARFSAAILHQAGIERILLVTHAWHMRRSLGAFGRLGLTVVPAPTAFYTPPPSVARLLPSMTALRMSFYALHELIGQVWYAIRYQAA